MHANKGITCYHEAGNYASRSLYLVHGVFREIKRNVKNTVDRIFTFHSTHSWLKRNKIGRKPCFQTDVGLTWVIREIQTPERRTTFSKPRGHKCEYTWLSEVITWGFAPCPQTVQPFCLLLACTLIIDTSTVFLAPAAPVRLCNRYCHI
jgi:hypothetical protein